MNSEAWSAPAQPGRANAPGRECSHWRRRGPLARGHVAAGGRWPRDLSLPAPPRRGGGGILETIYVSLKEKTTLSDVHKLYRHFYKIEPFVRVLDEGNLPETKYVANTNYCDIGLTLRQDGKLLVITSAIDNLVKGAGGQAVQNMNIICNFEETLGLK